MGKGTTPRSGTPGGRPALPPGSGKRHALGIRTTEVLKARIESAARASGRSVAQEIEHRLERSLDQEADEATYGSQGNALLWLIGRQLRAAASIRAIPVESDWLNDAGAF